MKNLTNKNIIQLDIGWNVIVFLWYLPNFSLIYVFLT
ncbi:hypothetical protein ABH916_000237 [Peribacillus frigoritolerans]|nr:hypothetical protein FB545_0023 [Peribacillus frigoritolerans]